MSKKPRIALTFASLIGLLFTVLTALPAMAADQATLFVTKSGNGSGTITGSGINCGSDCSQSYDVGTDVTLTATESTTSVFTGWSGGGCSGIAPCEVDVNATKTVQANFLACTITQNYFYAGTSWIYGSLGDDVICGTAAADAIIDFGGNDFISGKGGGDVILGNMGNDFISGGPGNDYLFGELGDDVLIGGDGTDYAYGDIPLDFAPQGTDVCDAENKYWGCES
jgi:Ca2+-binding RTX toxin-like protein